MEGWERSVLVVEEEEGGREGGREGGEDCHLLLRMGDGGQRWWEGEEGPLLPPSLPPPPPPLPFLGSKWLRVLSVLPLSPSLEEEEEEEGGREGWEAAPPPLPRCKAC